MGIAGKIFNRLTLHCIYAVCIGVFVVAIFVALLSLYGVESAPESAVRMTAHPMIFPENEEMLNAASDQLAREGEALRNHDAAALSEIEPAAGDAKKGL